MIKCMKANSGSIMLVKGRKNLEVAASTNAKLVGMKQPMGEDSPSAWVVKNKTPLYVDDIRKSRLFKKRFDHYKKGAFLLVPITSADKVIGVLSVTDKKGDDVFSKEEREILLNIGIQVISALENQRLTESLNKKRKTLQQKNAQLRKLEKLAS